MISKVIDSFKANKTIIFLTLITLFGLILRLNAGLPSLANDEVATLRTASLNFPHEILDALLNKNLHAPLYYFMLHFWMKIFGDSLFALRLLPVLLGTFCIPVSYYCVKKLCLSERAAIIAALLVCINPFLIIFSAYTKFYALLQLLGFLSILFLAKVKKNDSNLNILGLAIVNALIVYTFVLGFLFVVIQFVLFIAYLMMKKKANLKNFSIKYLLILFLLIVPVAKYIFVIIHKTGANLLPTFWWYTFEIADIQSVIYSLFSPALPAILRLGAMTDPTQTYLSNNLLYIFLFNMIPLLIAAFGLAKGLLKKDFVGLLFLMALIFILAELSGAIWGKFAFCSRYLTLVFPCIIITMAYGLSLIKNKIVPYVFIILMLGLNIFFDYSNIEKVFNTNPNEIEKMGLILNSYAPTKNDFVIIPYRGYYLGAFFDTKKVNFISFDINYSYKIKDMAVLGNILDEKYLAESKISPHSRFGEYIRSTNPTNQISEYLHKNCLNKLSNNSRVFLVLYTNNPNIEDLVVDENYYSNQSIFKMLLSKINFDIKNVVESNLKLNTLNSEKYFDIYMYKK